MQEERKSVSSYIFAIFPIYGTMPIDKHLKMIRQFKDCADSIFPRKKFKTTLFSVQWAHGFTLISVFMLSWANSSCIFSILTWEWYQSLSLHSVACSPRITCACLPQRLGRSLMSEWHPRECQDLRFPSRILHGNKIINIIYLYKCWLINVNVSENLNWKQDS